MTATRQNKATNRLSSENSVTLFSGGGVFVIFLFYPFILVSQYIYLHLHQEFGFPALAAGILAAIPDLLCFYALYISRLFRTAYCGLYTLGGAAFAYIWAAENYNSVGGGIAALFALIVGGIVTYGAFALPMTSVKQST